MHENPKTQGIISPYYSTLTFIMTAISILKLGTSTLYSSYVFKKAVIHCLSYASKTSTLLDLMKSIFING